MTKSRGALLAASIQEKTNTEIARQNTGHSLKPHGPPTGQKKNYKTYSTRDSHVVTYHSTSLAVRCLYMEERTGFLSLIYLWPYVLGRGSWEYMWLGKVRGEQQSRR